MRLVTDLLFAPIGAALIWLINLGRVSYREIYWGKPKYTKTGFQDPVARVRNGILGVFIVLAIVATLKYLNHSYYHG